MAKERFTDNTYSLAKGLHHVNIAKMYFEDLRLSTRGDIKHIFNQYIQRCDWIVSNLSGRLNEENRKNLEQELADSISFEAINDKLILLDPPQREFLEKIIDAMTKGEKVEIIPNEPADK
jgi:hypothetical protein